MSGILSTNSWNLYPPKKKKTPTVNLGINRCMICGKTRAQAGRLERAHVLARSKGGKVTVLLCPKHHVEYDEGRLSKTQLAKIGVSRSRYGRFRPSRKKARRKSGAAWIQIPEVKIPNYGF